MNRTFHAFLLLLLSSGCMGAPPMIVFKGTVSARYNNTLVHLTHIPSGQTDSALVKNGTFIFKQKFSGPCLYVMTAKRDENSFGWTAPLGILAEQPGIITIQFNRPNSSDATIKGSNAQNLYEAFLRERKRLQDIQLGQQPIHDSMKKHPDHAVDRLVLSDEADTVTAPLALRTAMKYPNSLAAPYILENHTENVNIIELEKVYYSLSEKMRNTYPGKRVRVRLGKLKGTDRGQTVYPFSLPDSSGKAVSFSEVKDKVVLINFWASWCVPCREEFKLLRYLHEKYHHKGFAIISISVDASAVLWKTALEKEQLPWLQLRDLDKTTSIAERRFEVTGLPTTFLINNKRKILYRDLRGGVLDKVIEGLVMGIE
jgi:thiol-disulfide isomerase/thioredoxin